MVKEMLRRIFGDRRHERVQVGAERRGRKVSSKQADNMLKNAIQDLEKTVRMKREDFLRK